MNNTTTTATDIRNARTAVAKSDMRIARREGSVAICGTKRGNVSLEFDADTKTFRVDTMGIDSECLIKNVKGKEAHYAIGDLYIVE